MTDLPDSEPNYDFGFYNDNVYGHALALLERSAIVRREGSLHLDIGCGFGRIAEPLVERIGAVYVGVDGSERGPASLRERGFEAHELLFTDEEETYAALARIVAGRRVGSITFLDVIEHLVDGAAVLRAIARLARENDSAVVIAAPNMGHADIGLKLVFGRWDYTDHGLLDRTHVRLFDNKLLVATLQQSGLFPVDAFDVEKIVGDQSFPASHPALAGGTLLHNYLLDLRTQIDPFAFTHEFVRLCVPGPRMDVATFVDGAEPVRPLLTILVRTDGKDLAALTESLLCLTGQGDTDFEVILLAHRVEVDVRHRIERALEDMPKWIREKSRVEWVEIGNATRPLNVGFELAEGQYISILDGDLPAAGWVGAFRKLAADAPGSVLRTGAALQSVVPTSVADQDGLIGEGPLDRIAAEEFDFVGHLSGNSTPLVSLAFPRGAFHDLNIRFDEALTTDADWDYLMRVVGIVGIVTSADITAIARAWPYRDHPETTNLQDERQKNQQRVMAKLDDAYFILPKGAASRIRLLGKRAAEVKAGLSEPLALPEDRSVPEPVQQQDAGEAAGWMRRAIQSARGWIG